MLKFEILGSDGGVLRVVEIDKSPIKVGKMSTSALSIDDASVSRMHARIEVSGGIFKVVDLGSAGGTYVNDQKVMAQQFYSGDVLRFGNVKVRCTQVGASAVEGAKPEMRVSAPMAAAVPAAAEAPSAAAPAASPSPGLSLSKPGFSGAPAGFGFSSPSPSQPQIIRRKKKGVSFERRFLSERCPKGEGSLEIAHMWRDEVIKIRQFASRNDSLVTLGAETGKKGADFVVEDQRLGGRTPILQRKGDTWQLLFTNEFDGFLLVDPSKYSGVERIAFKDCTPGQFPPASVSGSVKSGWMSVDIDGETRAKLIFGEVAILVHCVKTSIVPVGVGAGAKVGVGVGIGAAMLASLFLHFSLFSVILFATDRVDALMVDRILTTSRFAEALVQPEEVKDIDDEDEPDEEEVVEEDIIDDNAIARDAVTTPFAAAKTGAGTGTGGGAGSGSGMSRGEAVGVAQATGLLAQANMMSSMLASGAAADNFDGLDWSSFDASAAAASAGYGMGMAGGGGGGSAMGGFGSGGFGPGGGRGGGGGGGAVGVAARSHQGDIGGRREATPVMKAGNPEVTGALDKRVIQKVVQQHRAELRACYEREVARVKGLSGKLDVNWIIAANGSVVSVGINESTIRNKNVEDCVTNSIKRWRFPAPKGGGMVRIATYPFVFEVGAGN